MCSHKTWLLNAKKKLNTLAQLCIFYMHTYTNTRTLRRRMVCHKQGLESRNVLFIGEFSAGGERKEGWGHADLMSL